MEVLVEVLAEALLIACKELVKYKTRYMVAIGGDTIDDPSPNEYANLFVKQVKENKGIL